MIKVIDEKYQKIPNSLKKAKETPAELYYKYKDETIFILFHKFMNGHTFSTIVQKYKDEKKELIIIYYNVPLL